MSTEIKEYLERNGYGSIDDWALDSDMKKRNGTWYDSNNNEIDPEEYLCTLINEGIAE